MISATELCQILVRDHAKEVWPFMDLTWIMHDYNVDAFTAQKALELACLELAFENTNPGVKS